MNATRNRILDAALELLGRDPKLGMGDIATAAGVVRRTVYGHFPTRAELVHALTERAADEIVGIVTELNASDRGADEIWAAFIARLWPLAHRYRVLLALRRGEYGEQIHALLGPVDRVLADLVRRGQRSKVFARHLPADVLSQVAYTSVFALADHAVRTKSLGARAAAITSLLILGVPEDKAQRLAHD